MEGSRLVAKTLKYTPIGDDINAATVFIQATEALDLAAALALGRQDVEGLNTVASLYIELGARLLGEYSAEEEEDDEVDHEALAKKIPLGFNPPEIIPVEQEELDVDGWSEDE